MEKQAKSITLTRQELYKQIWSSPTRKLAIEFGLSDVGLAKICRKNNIPKPPLGYWARLKFGYKSKQPSLPASPKGKGETITIKRSIANICVATEDSMLVRAIEEEKNSDKVILVPINSLAKNHEVESTRRALMNNSPDKYDRSRPSSKLCLDINVSEKTVTRALAIWDSLISALKSRGHDLRVKVPYDHSRHYSAPTVAVIFGEEIRIKMEEPMSKYRLPEDQQQSYYRRAFGYKSTGRLVFSIENYLGEGYQTKFSESKRLPWESNLNLLIIGLLKASERVKVIRLEDEKLERIRLEEKAIADELKRCEKVEAEKIEDLHVKVTLWTEYKKISDYICEVESIAPVSGHELEMKEWLIWAKAFAASINSAQNPMMSKNASELLKKLQGKETREYGYHHDSLRRDYWTSRKWWSKR